MRQATCALLFRNVSRRAAAPRSLAAARQPGRGGAQRLIASPSQAPPARPTAAAAQPRDQGQEAIDKAGRLHAELNELIASQRARQAEEMQRPFGAGFLAFLRASKPELVNIFFAFVCVLLAYQVHGMRAGIKRLQAAQEEKEADVARLRALLSDLSAGTAAPGDGAGGDAFAQRAARRCAGAVREMFEEAEQRVGYGWILGKKLTAADSLESQRLVDDLRPLILAELRAEVGEAACTPEEVRERRVAALTAGVGKAAPSGRGARSEDAAAPMGDLMHILEQVHDRDLAEGTQQRTDDEEPATTTVRRTRYAI